MKFYGNGYILHEGKVLEFVDGELETNDVALIERMKEYFAYEAKGIEVTQPEIEVEVEEIIDYENMTNAELKKILDSKNIEYIDRATKKELIGLIGGE